MKYAKKIILVIGLLFGCVYLLKYIVEWSVEFNEHGFSDAQHCIFEDQNHHEITLNSMGHEFEVFYVKNASEKCVCPYFPAVYITTKESHNKWLFVDYSFRGFVHYNYKSMVQLIDDLSQADEKEDIALRQQLSKEYKDQGHQLFYSSQQDFFADQSAVYFLYNKGSVNWKGNAYALQVDLDKKTVRCIGGISWGFKVPWWSIRPAMTGPVALSKSDWKHDFAQLVLNRLKEYQDITD